MNYKNFFVLIIFEVLMLTAGSPDGFPRFLYKIDSPKIVIIPEKKETVITEEKIILTTKDGLKRHAIITTQPNAKGNIVLCHPATRDKEYMKEYQDKLFPNYNCIRFDFRRHGEDSENQYSTIGLNEANEVEAAVEIFKKRDNTKKLPIYGFGISLGAAALIQAESKKHMFNGLILQSSYEKLKYQIKRMVSFYNLPLMDIFIFTFPVNMYVKTKYRIKLRSNNLVKEIKKIKTPIFLIHAKNDSFIPISAFEDLKKAASTTIKKTWTPEDGKHTKLLNIYPELYHQQCSEFLENLQQTNKLF